jgi:hypothetical protein
MAIERPRLALARRSGHPYKGGASSHKPLKTALWIVWLPIIAVLWVMVLDTSYDWISSPSTSKVIAGSLILILMVCVVIGLVVKGARKLWTR